MNLECAICHESVPTELSEAHLAARHPTPEGGFLFFYDGKPYHTDKPSMLISDLMALVGETRQLDYRLYEERGSETIPMYYGNSVDLTNGPRRFFLIPAATF